MPAPSPCPPNVDAALCARIAALADEGRASWKRFEADVRSRGFHPFMPADYDDVLRALAALRTPGGRFLEWGSATGTITVMADLLGFDAYGIELDPALVDTARRLADRFQSGARFAAGSFLPDDYRWHSPSGDERTGTIGDGASGYAELGHPLDDFDVVYGYPWPGEAPMMLDLMRERGAAGALLLLNAGASGIRSYRDGRREA